MVNEILRELGASPDAAVVVGDTEFDMKMAHNAGVAAVAAVYGNHASERLIASRPLATIGSLHDLPLVLASARSLRRPRAGRDDARETRRNGFP